MTTIRAFSPKIGTLFPISEKEQGRPPLLPLSSYAPWFLGQTDIIFNHKWRKTTKLKLIWVTKILELYQKALYNKFSPFLPFIKVFVAKHLSHILGLTLTQNKFDASCKRLYRLLLDHLHSSTQKTFFFVRKQQIFEKIRIFHFYLVRPTYIWQGENKNFRRVYKK